jgi:hypothetical protein
MIKHVITLTLFISACRASVPVTDTETVGALTRSTTHVYAAPVHASTDLEPTALVIPESEPSANQSVTDNDRPSIEPKASHGF